MSVLSAERKSRVIKYCDRLVGTSLAKLMPRPSGATAVAAKPRAILLIRPGGIGDAVLLAPAVRCLHRLFPGAAIDVLAERRNCGIFALHPGIRRISCYDSPLELLKVLRQRYDIVIDTEQWHRLSAIVARLVRSPVKIGFATNERARLFNCSIPYRQDDYEATSFLRLLESFGVDAEVFPLGKWLEIPDDVRASATSLLPPDDRSPTVVIFPGASIAEKRWSTVRFREVAAWCLGQERQVVLVGGAAERSVGEAIAAGLDVVNLVGATTLAQTAAVIDRALIVVSGDSGALHLAAGLDRPTVALFGPSSALKWAPRGTRHIVIAKCDCSPCSRFGYTPHCPHGIRCMDDITVADVTGAIANLLESSEVRDVT